MTKNSCPKCKKSKNVLEILVSKPFIVYGNVTSQILPVISKGICANGGRANRISLTGHANQEERPLVLQDHQVDMEEKVRFNYMIF